MHFDYNFENDLMDFSIYDTLLSLPLFQGLSKHDFDEILAKVRFDFSAVREGETFISRGSLCMHFVFLLNGRIMSHRTSADGRLEFSEEIEAPAMIEPHSMFGIDPTFKKDYIASENIGLLRIEKQYLYSELYKYSICRMNLLNMLSGRIQVMENGLWELRETNIRERIANIVAGLSEYATGRKEVRVKMEDLAAILGETRLNVSRALNELEKEGRIILKRGGFTVLTPDFKQHDYHD